jgi:hypothetical protein
VSLVGSETQYSKTVSRPDAINSTTSTIEFPVVSPGQYQVVAEAYPNPDGTGTIQARGVGAITVVAGQRSGFDITMASTVTSVTVTGPTTLFVGEIGTYTAIARNSEGTQVLVDPATWVWTPDPDIEILSTNGNERVLKPIADSNLLVSTAYAESGATTVVGTASLLATLPLFDPGTPYESTSPTDLPVLDITANSAAGNLMIGTGAGRISALMPPKNPTSESSFYQSGNSTASILATASNSGGTIFAIVQDGSNFSLIKGTASLSPFATLPSDSLDIGCDSAGNAYVLYHESGVAKIRVFNIDGSQTTRVISGGYLPTKIAVDQFGTILVAAQDAKWLLSDDSLAPAFDTQLLLSDIACHNANAYILHSDSVPEQLKISVISRGGNGLFNVSTNAFFTADDLKIRFAVDPLSGDITLMRGIEDISFTKQFQAITLAQI